MLLSDEEILHRVDTHVGEPNQKYPLNGSDWKNFARAIEAAILAKLAAKDLPEPVGAYELVVGQEEWQGLPSEIIEMRDAYSAAQLQEAHAQGFAAGAAAQLAEKPSAFLDVVMDCAYTLQELGGNPVSEFTPLYTRRESK